MAVPAPGLSALVLVVVADYVQWRWSFFDQMPMTLYCAVLAILGLLTASIAAIAGPALLIASLVDRGRVAIFVSAALCAADLVAGWLAIVALARL